MFNVKNLNIKNSNIKFIFSYRYDFFALAIIFISILVYFDILWNPGQIVFSDIDFPFNAEGYLNEIIGLWNNRWNTTSMLNIPRLFVVLPTYLLAKIFGLKGSLFLKAFIIQLILMSALSTYLLTKRLVSIYTNRTFDLPKTLSLIFGSILYALNPYVIFRIQHIYLLVGYSLFPLVLLYFFKLFDHKFQQQMIAGYSPYSGKIYAENIRDAFVLAYLLTIASAAIHYFFYSVMALGIIYILLIIKYVFKFNGKDRLKVINNMIKKLFVFGIIFIGFSFFWLSIYIGSILVNASATQHNINVIDTFTMFSRNSTFKEVLFLISYWWRMVPDSVYNTSFFLGGGILISIMFFGMVFNGHKRHIILLVSILGGLMLLLATGVNYPIISKMFLVLCNLPFFGNVFRDPNKLVGLLALSYSVLLIFGLEAMVELFKKRTLGTLLTTLVFSGTAIALIMFLWPMKDAFVDSYYQPVTEPQAFKELRHYSDDKPAYSLYLPIAEQMLRPIHNVSTPRWNSSKDKATTKATGDVHIYNAPVNTLFHHEGNNPMITYYINWMQWLIDQGRTSYLSRYINALGIDQLIYHDEYMDYEARQQFNLEIIKRQTGLSQSYGNEIFSLFSVEEEKNDLPIQKIWSPYGVYKLEMYQRLNQHTLLDQPVVFLNQQSLDISQYSEEADYIDMQHSLDIYLATLDEEYKSYPFEWVKELNPFLKWSKTYLSNPDWAWYMQQLENVNKRFDLDQEKGVAVTFASGKLDIEPHLRKNYSGQLVMDFDTMLRTDSFFESEIPSIYEVQANPIKSLSSVGVVNGVLSKGDPKNIWQVAKSKLIKANENTPYSYNILISGRHTNKLHVKVRFYDKNREEIGIQYVTSPNEQVNFEAVNFVGETVSPKGTKYMRIDLLSFQRPEVKTYWWIHDVNIFDYSAYKVDNTIQGSLEIHETDEYELYIRSYQSPKSGIVQLLVDETSYDINNDTILSGFVWTYIGNQFLEEGNLSLAIENVEGFNAINQIAVVPVKEKDALFAPVKQSLKEAKQLIALEGEIDFEVSGNIQTRNLIPSLSYGAGLSLQEGIGKSSFEIIESQFYELDIALRFPSKNRGHVRFEIEDASGSIIVQKDINPSSEGRLLESEGVHYTPLSKEYSYKLVDYEERASYTGESIKDAVFLTKGNYQLNVYIESHAENLTPAFDLDKFDPNELVVSNYFATPYDQT